MASRHAIHTTDREAGVRVLTLDRTPANAVDVELLADLGAALDAARADDGVRAVVLTGGGAFFSAGVDLATIDRAAGVGAIVELFRAIRRVLVALLGFPRPTVCMVNGHAIGGGLVLALACDYRLGLDGGWNLGLDEVSVGASYPLAAHEVLRLRLPHARVAELVLGGALYPASQAIRLGVVDELLPADRCEATVLRRAARMGAFPREAYVHAKQALVADALARIAAETPEEERAAASVWLAPESVAAGRARPDRAP
jgi:enoyl-CoA hydratase